MTKRWSQRWRRRRRWRRGRIDAVARRRGAADSEAPTQKKTSTSAPPQGRFDRDSTATRGDDAFDDDDIEDDPTLRSFEDPVPKPPRPSRAAAAVASPHGDETRRSGKGRAEDSTIPMSTTRS